jgi:hypothetical protein
LVRDPQWKILQQIGLKDPSGQQWSLIHREENIQHLVYDDAISIKLARDVKKEQMFTGAYYRQADFENGIFHCGSLTKETDCVGQDNPSDVARCKIEPEKIIKIVDK